LKPRNKRLIIGVASMAVLDLAGLVTMVAAPDLTARIIPALFGVQIFGFVAIAAIVVTSKREYVSAEEADRQFWGTGRQWVPWLFGFLALLSFLRVILALLYIAGEEGHSHSWFSPIVGAAAGCFFLWVAVKTRPLASKENQGKKPVA
jgi:hypothetical protein